VSAPRNRTLVLTDEDRCAPVPEIPPAPAPDGIYCGDGVEGLRRSPPADLIFADPPYDRDPDWHAVWIEEAARALRPGGSIYVCCDWRLSGPLQAILERHFTVRNRITWKRDKGRGARRNWKQNMEDLWFATKGDDYTFNLVKWKKRVIAPYRENGRPKDWVEEDGGRWRWTCPSNIWTDLCVPFWSMPENTPHPFQKPEKLVARGLEASSRPGDLVVDPFLGSGTTAVVARRLGRRFLGFEIEPDYVRLALKRLRERP
jgi:site-specific DNA-methyltransferase (adenine-specific)